LDPKRNNFLKIREMEASVAKLLCWNWQK
jgi:hypothetical protein